MTVERARKAYSKENMSKRYMEEYDRTGRKERIGRTERE